MASIAQAVKRDWERSKVKVVNSDGYIFPWVQTEGAFHYTSSTQFRLYEGSVLLIKFESNHTAPRVVRHGRVSKEFIAEHASDSVQCGFRVKSLKKRPIS